MDGYKYKTVIRIMEQLCKIVSVADIEISRCIQKKQHYHVMVVLRDSYPLYMLIAPGNPAHPYPCKCCHTPT